MEEWRYNCILTFGSIVFGSIFTQVNRDISHMVTGGASRLDKPVLIRVILNRSKCIAVWP